jgi:type III secretory pathway component EscV
MCRLYINKVSQEYIKALQPGEYWVYCSPDQLVDEVFGKHWEFRPSIEPNSGYPAAIVRDSEDSMKIWQENDYSAYSPLEYLTLFISAQVRKSVAEFVSDQLVEFYLDQLENNAYPDLIATVRTIFDIPTITAELRRQIMDGRPVKNLPYILNWLLEEHLSTFGILSQDNPATPES